MSEIVVFHHAQGLTPGVVGFADRLRGAGHTVHTPDLYEGRTFDRLEEGVGHAQQVGFDTIGARGATAVEELPAELVYLGFSLGVVPAEQLVVHRPGARGAVFFHAAMPASEFGGRWPDDVPLQVHAMEHDPEFDNGFDRPAAEALVAEVGGELFLYPGEEHLFLDSSLPAYDADAAELAVGRVLAFLAAL